MRTRYGSGVNIIAIKSLLLTNTQMFSEQCHNIISGIYKISCKSNEGVEDMFNDISRILLNANVQKLDMQSIELQGGFKLNRTNSQVDADSKCLCKNTT